MILRASAPGIVDIYDFDEGVLGPCGGLTFPQCWGRVIGLYIEGSLTISGYMASKISGYIAVTPCQIVECNRCNTLFFLCRVWEV